ncbi:PQQ-binding-like beta-propeller repeat protein [Flammeovirga sp. MY04]|nr:PQQ-binding-like beta-propeller repeat protein [Flammeovirga sp. MY04]ANQ52804.1 PQQ-binding-like beta-propeller repeat protein [Flammeovirga sp. MY04]
MKKYILILFYFISISLVDAQNSTTVTSFISCSDQELDHIRQDVFDSKTKKNNINERFGALVRLWRLYRKQGFDMRPFDAVANQLLMVKNDQKKYALIDEGFAVLEQIIKNGERIPEIRGTKSLAWNTKTNWPYYHGIDGHQAGNTTDIGPQTGKVIWKFPKRNGWKASAIVKDGKVYCSGADSEIIAYCLDEKTGEILWKGKRFSDSFYHTAGSKYSPLLSGSSLIIKTSGWIHSFNTQTGKHLYSKKALGQKKNNSSKEIILHQLWDRVIVANEVSTGDKVWSLNVEGRLNADPIQVDTFVYFTTDKNTLFKVDKNTGSVLFKKSFDETLRGKISIQNQLIVLQNKEQELFAFDEQQQTVLWKNSDQKEKNLRSYEFYSEGVFHQSDMIIGGSDQKIYCFDVVSGQKKWDISTNDWVRSKPKIFDNHVYFADLSGHVYKYRLRKKSPKKVWTKKISDHGFMADLQVNNQGVVCSDRNMMLYSLSLNDAQVNWKHSQLDGVWKEDQFYASGEVSGQQASPTIVDGKLYISSPDGFVNAIDVETGKELWKFELKSSSSTTPAVAEGKVFVGQTYGSFGKYYALDKDTGQPVWETEELDDVWIGAGYKNGRIFLGNMDGYFFSVDASTGKILWKYYTSKDTPNEDKPLTQMRHGWPAGVYCNPIIHEDIVITGSWAGYYFCFDQNTGKLIWRTKTQPDHGKGGLPDSSAPVLFKNKIYVQEAGNRLTALDLLTGKKLKSWKVTPGFLQNGTVAVNSNIMVGSCIRSVTKLPYQADIVAFDPFSKSLDPIWTYNGGGGLTASVLTDQHIIFGSSADPFLTCLDFEGKVIWRTYVGGIMLESVPSIYGNKVFALIKNGYLYAIE